VASPNAIIPASPPVSTKLSFAQLEGLWLQAGGAYQVAPVMAAIALAESGGRPTATNLTDNGGTQSSFGLWQISTGTHNPPNPNWSNPLTNAQLAVTKYNSQGLNAWGTYTSGAYKQTLPTAYALIAPTTAGVVDADTAPNTSTVDGGAATAKAVSCYWKIDIGVGSFCMDDLLWGGLIAIGGIALLVGAAFTVIGMGQKSPAVAKVAGIATKFVPGASALKGAVG
jgi:Lysozyme like domain